VASQSLSGCSGSRQQQAPGASGGAHAAFKLHGSPSLRLDQAACIDGVEGVFSGLSWLLLCSVIIVISQPQAGPRLTGVTGQGRAVV
jgi:hypothetical protein